MEKILCVYCGDLFDPSPRHKNQTACKKEECQRAKKAACQRHKMKTDPDYRFNQKLCQRQWVESRPGYWKAYRENNPEKAERNRILQAIRNRRARSKQGDDNLAPLLIAKMDASRHDNFEVLGQFWMVPVIAKMDALKVNILKIPIIYP
ncbi:MAG: hypothetical protein ABII26_07110 [Pseudomonadota bacterium]